MLNYGVVPLATPSFAFCSKELRPVRQSLGDGGMAGPAHTKIKFRPQCNVPHKSAKDAPRSSQSVVGWVGAELERFFPMYYVYRIRSITFPDREYTGFTSALTGALMLLYE